MGSAHRPSQAAAGIGRDEADESAIDVLELRRCIDAAKRVLVAEGSVQAAELQCAARQACARPWRSVSVAMTFPTSRS